MHILLSAHLMVVLACAPAVATACDCRLPVPDGGDEAPSPENLRGQIASVAGSEIVIRQAGTSKLVTVRVPEPHRIFSAFGGDVPLADVAKGQAVWVWFLNCEWPSSGTPVSAYFQIYSKDPNDQP